MSKVFWAMIILLIGSSLAACSPASLAGTSWELATLNGQPALPGVTVTMLFGSSGQLTGSDGCNSYVGTYTTSGSQLTLNLGATTMMACPEAVMNQESAFGAAVKATTNYNMSSGNLVLKDASSKELATFSPLKAAALSDTKWEALYVNNGKQAVTSLLANTKITAVFGKDGTLAGNAGCNQYNTTYKTDGNKITIQPSASTRMACDQPVMDQEQQYLTALTNAATYSLGKGTLELRDATGALQVEYTASK